MHFLDFNTCGIRQVLTFDFENLLSMISPDIKIVVIHGELDQMIPFSAGLVSGLLPAGQAMIIDIQV